MVYYFFDLKRYRRGESSSMADVLHVTRNIRERENIIIQETDKVDHI